MNPEMNPDKTEQSRWRPRPLTLQRVEMAAEFQSHDLYFWEWYRYGQRIQTAIWPKGADGLPDRTKSPIMTGLPKDIFKYVTLFHYHDGTAR